MTEVAKTKEELMKGDFIHILKPLVLKSAEAAPSVILENETIHRIYTKAKDSYE